MNLITNFNYKTMNKFTLVLVFITSFSLSCFAQEKKDSIETKDIHIIKEYTPFLEDGNKKRFTPAMPAVKSSKPSNLQYAVPSQFKETTYEPDEIKPLPIQLNDEQTMTNFYLKTGYGTANNPLIQLAIAGAKKNNFSAGLLGNLHSLKGKQFSDQKMRDASIQLYGTKEITNYSLDANAHFDHQHDVLYGYDHTLYQLDEYRLKQTWNNYGAKISAQSNANEDLDYNVGFGFDLLKDRRYSDSEQQVVFTGGAKKVLANDWNAGADAQLSFRNTKTPQAAQKKSTASIFTVTPYVKPQLNSGDLKLGISLNNDKANGLKLFPHIDFQIPFANDAYIFYAGWKGETQMNGLLQLSQENARLSKNATPIDQTQQILTPIGVKGSLNSDLAFNLSLSRKAIGNASLYVQEDALLTIAKPRPTFDLVREEKLTSWVPQLLLNYQMGEKINATADIHYNAYKTKTNPTAYHLPAFSTAIDFDFKPMDNLTLGLDVNALSGIKPFDNKTLKSIFNANLNANYQLTDRFEIFLDANNIGNQKYERWKNYPVIGANILAGFVLSY